MQTFRDKDGRAWTLEITELARRRVKAATGVDFHQLAADGFRDAEGQPKFFSDIGRVLDVICLVSVPASGASKTTEEEFFACLNGDTIEAASEAFLAELILFSPPRSRPLLHKLQAKGMAALELDLARKSALVEAATPEQILERLQNGPAPPPSSAGTTSGPESAASIPTHGPSGSSG